MIVGMNLSSGSENLKQREMAGNATRAERSGRRDTGYDCSSQEANRKEIGSGRRGAEIPAPVRATVEMKIGEYDARRLRSQREVIRDVMLAAADCDTWLTLGELRALTRYGEASISAQLRHLRKLENGGYDVCKQRREDAVAGGVSADGRGECVWEYRILKIQQPGPQMVA